jgi:hypothetical protein
MDGDSIFLTSTPNTATAGTAALSSLTEDVATLPHDFSNASLMPVSTVDDMLYDIADPEAFLREVEGIDFSSTTSILTLTHSITRCISRQLVRIRKGKSRRN